MNNLVQAHTCDPKEVECPIDGTTVVFCVTTSMTTSGSFYDFQKKGATGNHYKELINSCSNCHFSGFLSDFEVIAHPVPIPKVSLVRDHSLASTSINSEQPPSRK